MSQTDLPFNHTWILFSPTSTPLNFGGTSVQTFMVMEARTRLILVNETGYDGARCPSGPLLVSLIDQAALRAPRKGTSPWPEVLIVAGLDHHGTGLDAIAASRGFRVEDASVEALAPYIGEFSERFRTMMDAELGLQEDDQDELLDEDLDDQGDDDRDDEHDSGAGLYRNDPAVEEGVLERLRLLERADWARKEDARHGKAHPASFELMLKAINGDDNPCVRCAAATIGCTPLDLGVFLSVYPDPYDFLEFLERLQCGDELSGYGVAALALACNGLKRSVLINIAPDYQLPALSLIISALRTAVEFAENDVQSDQANQAIDRLMRGARLLCMVDAGGVLGDFLLALTSLDPETTRTALTHLPGRLAKMAKTASDVGGKVADTIRDATAAMPIAPDAEQAALTLDSVASQLQRELDRFGPQMLMAAYMDEAIDLTEQPSALLARLYAELVVDGEDEGAV